LACLPEGRCGQRLSWSAAATRSANAVVRSSEVNANPKDTANWPKGVWTLPPSFALGEQNRAKYAAIGEADNFVLKFRKPAL
jgi:predicted methyltransferase